MATTFYDQPAMLSPPIELTWLGFRGVTHQMQQYGWHFVVERNDYDMSFCVAMTHERDKVYGVSAHISTDYMMAKRYRQNHLEKIGPIEVKIASEYIVNDRTFQPVDMTPVMDMESELMTGDIEPYSIEFFFNQFKKMKLPKGKRIYKPDTDGMKRRLDILMDGKT